MKKLTPVILALALVLMLLCAACGSEGATASVSATMPPVATPEPTAEPTAEPEVTPEPEATPEPEVTPEAQEGETEDQPEQQQTSTTTTTNSNSNSNSGTTQSQSEPEPQQTDPKTTAQSMTGATRSALESAIGSPNSSSYADSCLVPGAQDGMLYYDGFMVETILYADGSEIVFGVF